MNYIQALTSQITNWEFLDEPLYRWALFILALFAIMWGWSGVIDLMK